MKLPVLLTLALCLAASAHPALRSIETGFTIAKVRTAETGQRSFIAASSHEGTILGIGPAGAVEWTHPLSGFMNHDLWCDDITGDGAEEILAANADGTLYCLDRKGTLRWKFRPSEAPMYAVTVVRDAAGKPSVVCGGYDKSIHYLSGSGELIKEVPSSAYSREKPWGKDPSKPRPPKHVHIANFLRPLPQPDGGDHLIVHGAIFANSASGGIYLFKPLETKPYKVIPKVRSVGELRVCDIESDGNPEILVGSSSMVQDAAMQRIDIGTGETTSFAPSTQRKKLDNFGYRVLQPTTIGNGGERRYFALFGSRIFLIPADLDPKKTEVLTCKYSFNDMWPGGDGTIILASSQSGGSCVHILDTTKPGWKSAYEGLDPPGNIAAILRNSAAARKQLAEFQRPAHERDPLPVYLMTEKTDSVQDLVDDLQANHRSPIFLNNPRTHKEDWDRSAMTNEKYRNRRDGRMKYVLTQQEVLDKIIPAYEGAPGIAYWGGHGNDPYMFQRETTMKVLDAAKGRKTVLIFPELEDHSEDFTFCLNDLIYPLAGHARDRNANIYIRTKHAFWQGSIHTPAWSRLMSGEFADVFVPSMEETTDKTMEQSVAGRMGVWASGAVKQWGARCARDNTSFDRMRQHSHQMLPNHFLRQMVYNISSGATYINNFAVDQQYMSFLWELIAQGALYVPQRSELVSLSPVHLSMKDPDHEYLIRGGNVKWTTFYDEEFERNNPFVFGRLNGTWPGAPVTEWDFSRYAAGVKDRHLNYLPPYENGLVLITPPQEGVFAARNLPRGKLQDHLHPLYKGMLQEFITDGRNYYSADGRQTYAPNEHYKVIEAAIKDGAKKLPLTVSGDVAWVAAQTSPTRLRLTIIDGGYINPKDLTATVTFHTARPKAMTDLLDKKSFDLSNPAAVKIDIPCGLFRFIDVELAEPMRQK